MVTDDRLTVFVRRHPQDWKTAEYYLSGVTRMHVDNQSGGVGRATSHPAVFGYVRCDGMLAGELAHSCSHGPPPHTIKVCLPKTINRRAWPRIQERLAADRPASTSGRAAIVALADGVRRVMRTGSFERHFSTRLAGVLAASTIRDPEALLSASLEELSQLKGVGPAALAELKAFRAKPPKFTEQERRLFKLMLTGLGHLPHVEGPEGANGSGPA